MADIAIEQPGRAPWHLWVVGILSVLWNAAGAYVIMSAQSGAPMDMNAHEIAYYAAQASWFVTVTDVALIAALLGGLALLLRNRWAVHLYALSVAAIVVTAAYDIAQGTALVLQGGDWLVQAILTDGLALAQLAYAWAVRRVLR